MATTKEELEIPSHILRGLQRYKEFGVRPGSALTALLQNDLMDFVRFADAETIRSVKGIVRWCIWNLPHNSWGTADAVNAYVRRKTPESSE